MANKVFTRRNAAIRLVDGTSPTPLHVLGSWIGSLEGPVGRPRAEEHPQFNGGVADSGFHFNNRTDEQIFLPLEITIEGKLHHTAVTDDLIVAMSNPYDDATWQPGGTSTFTGITIAGTVVNADGTSVTLKGPADAHAAAHLVNAFILWDGDADWGLKYEGVFWPADQNTLASGDADDSSFSAKGIVYGAVSKITAFELSTEIT